MARWIMLSCLVMALCVMGCSDSTKSGVHGRRAASALMDSAESIMNDDPQQAYMLLDSIDSGSLRSRALNARYALLYTEAQYKNYMPIRNDSLIMIAVRYYSVGNHAEQLFRSFYCLGCIYYELGQLTDAAVALGQAEQLAGKIDDGYRLGLLYTQLGEAFINSFDFHRAEQYYRRAADFYSKGGKEIHHMYALYDVSRCLVQTNDYVGAHSLLEEVLQWSETHNDKNLELCCLSAQLICSLRNKDLDRSQTEFNRYLTLTHDKVKTPLEYSLFAEYYLSIKDYSLAVSNINKGWACSSTKSDSIKLFYAESLLNEKIGNMDSAIVYYKQSIELQNRNLRVVIDQPVVGAQKEYFKTLAQVESLKASRNRHLVFFITILTVLLLIIIRITTRSRILKMEAEMQDYMLTIKELKLKDDLKDKLVNEKNKRINSLFSNQYAELDDIFGRMIEVEASLPNNQDEISKDFYKQRYYKNTVIFYKQIQARLNEFKSSKNQKELKRIINENYNNIMDRLADKKLKLTGNDQLIMLFLLSGFSPKVVAHIVSEQQKYIYQKRSRIISRIDRESEELSLELRNILKCNR